ncbi:MAG: PQQ-binding-like beta-propeller repeat protein [Hyphomicrobiales bacterium]|nr:PQQ-binding-like beta-propeller repeat protein [Hyphomicrobiales bacterium]
MRKRFITFGIALCSIILLNACQLMPEWMGKDENAPMPGNRISVLSYQHQWAADTALAHTKVALPASQYTDNWPLQHTTISVHPSLSGNLSSVKTYDVGDASEDGRYLTSAPLIVGTTLYVLDGEGRITARDRAKPSEMLWSYQIDAGTSEDDFLGYDIGSTRKQFLGGNLGYGDGLLVITTRRGRVIALDSASGTSRWTRKESLPIISPAVIGDGYVYFVRADNTLIAAGIGDGATSWTHSGFEEETGVMGAPAPVLRAGRIVVTYSSGEIHVLNAHTGVPLWSTTLTRSGSGFSRPALNDITATPVVYDGMVYASAVEGMFTALDFTTGAVRWQRDIPSANTPWVAGGYIFILTSDNTLLCLERASGSIRWVHSLSNYEEGSGLRDKGDRIIWSGPVLAGNTLLVAGSDGSLTQISPFTGQAMGNTRIPEGVTLPPVVAGGNVYLISNDATLAIVN